MYVAKQYCVVKQEKNPDEFFDDDCVQDRVAMDNHGNFLSKIDHKVFLSSNQAEDIALVCNQGYYVDDNNKPAPENVPGTTAPLTVDNAGLFDGQRWGVNHHGSKKTPSFNEFDTNRSVSLSIFFEYLPFEFAVAHPFRADQQ